MSNMSCPFVHTEHNMKKDKTNGHKVQNIIPKQCTKLLLNWRVGVVLFLIFLQLFYSVPFFSRTKYLINCALVQQPVSVHLGLKRSNTQVT